MEILPILRVNVLGMVNLLDGSGLAVASLAYDISDESAFSAGLMVPWGAGYVLGIPEGDTTLQPVPRSEFGVYPVTLFVESRFYF